MKTHRFWLVALALATLLVTISPTAFGQKKDSKKKDSVTRSVKGLVTTEAEDPLPGAVVQLKNTRTLQVKSFIADSQGTYYFHGLDPATDYELKARYEEETSKARTVSSFDGRDEVIFNFQIKVKK